MGGVYTAEVKKSVETFQVMVHMPATGIASEQTVHKLLEYTHQDHAVPGYLARGEKTGDYTGGILHLEVR
jgi:predicted phosphohydrolase